MADRHEVQRDTEMTLRTRSPQEQTFVVLVSADSERGEGKERKFSLIAKYSHYLPRPS